MIQCARSTIWDGALGTLTWHVVCYYYCCRYCYYYIARRYHPHHPARQTQGAMASSSNLYRGAYFKERIMSPNVPITQLPRGQSYFTYYLHAVHPHPQMQMHVGIALFWCKSQTSHYPLFEAFLKEMCLQSWEQRQMHRYALRSLALPLFKEPLGSNWKMQITVLLCVSC